MLQLSTPETPPITETGEPYVAVRGLWKSFGQRQVLAGIDLIVQRAETVSVLGCSGTGKSVLLKLLIGLQKPDSGSVRIAGKDISHLAIDELNAVRKKIGFLFQQAALYDSLTVAENVEFPLKRHTQSSPAARKERVLRLLSSVGMEQDLHKLPSEISGGMQKRVGIARALALDPELLLFDEPTSGLDPLTAIEIGNLISKLNRERSITAIVVTHDIPAARAFTDRFVVLHEGRVAGQGTFEELQRSREPFVERLLSSLTTEVKS
ncbi:MAG: ATP-binding cassette domain-containing protein [Acidobacteria bacterium]|nr:ATP-binding cassette domain-containing protein [Acidobacteriota bacterium]